MTERDGRPSARYVRRAWPLLGTLVEAAVLAPEDGEPARADALRRLDAAREAISRAERYLSRFLPGSDVARFNAAPVGGAIPVHRGTAAVLQAARQLAERSAGVFDPTCGTGPGGWRLERLRLSKLARGVRLGLGGIAKGYAVDLAVRALQGQDARGGWVNAGGDLRVFGEAHVPVWLRDEDAGARAPSRA